MRRFPTPEAAAAAAARYMAELVREGCRARGRFIAAVSGGSTPWQMLSALGEEDLPWADVHFAQVDERVAPDGHQDRNLTSLENVLASSGRMRAITVHPMPVADPDLEGAGARYASRLKSIAGDPLVFDLVTPRPRSGRPHRFAGFLGTQYSTRRTADVALTGSEYQGRRRMTLTYPAINRARAVLWLITGAAKSDVLKRMLDGDRSLPAGRVEASAAVVFADAAAASAL